MSYQNQDGVYADLTSGRLDAALQDEVQAAIGFLKCRAARTTRSSARLVDEKVLGIGAGIGLRKEDTDLKAKIDGAILEMVSDGTYSGSRRSTSTSTSTAAETASRAYGRHTRRARPTAPPHHRTAPAQRRLPSHRMLHPSHTSHDASHFIRIAD